ncbi:phage tail spike protein [Bacillus pseudomycoides]|uniref:phage tail spike protein n=1 Tax=Bacillus pseudomycoides TaxID=64104 RepID=UPI000BECCEDD|nr:phage tail spike protein [Bacillus pseudomycoides]PDY48442.1 hypothetical protein CON79_04290 [Bacillus pseudomycoides]PHB44243.1 hypothetical protein COE83_18975 [Bacillus pseudomycoides]
MKNTLHILDFKTEATVGIIDEEDYRNDIRKWDLENALDTFEFEVSEDIRDAFTLMSHNIIAKRVREGGYVTYYITEIDQGSDGRSKKIVALSEHVKLKGAKVILPQKLEQYTVAQLIDFCTKGTKWKRGITEFASFRTINIDKPTNPLALLQRLKSEFGMELRFRTVIKSNQIVARYVDAIKRVGNDSGKEITLGKDLIGINRIENSQNIVTALVPVLDRGEDGILTIEAVNDGKNFVYDFDAFKRWHQDGHHIFDIYTPETEQDMKPERLKQLAEMELKKRINTSQNYKVDAQSLEKIFGLSHEAIRRGDTIRIKDTKFSPPLYLEARAIAAEECDTDPSKDKYYFGDYREIVIVSDELQKWYRKILGMLETKANKPLLDKLEELVKANDKKTDAAQKESEAAKQLAEQVVKNLENYQTTISEGITAPTVGLVAGKSLWQDISQGKPGVLKKWNGTEWEVLLKDYGKDITDLDERTAKFETSMNGLTSDVEQLSITTTEQGKQITDANTKIEQNSQAIEAKVDIKQVEGYVGGIGAMNEIRNTRFTQGTKYWGYYTADKSPLVVDKDTTHLGDFSFRLSVAGQTAPIYNSFTSNRIPVTPGEDVVVSAYFMTKNIDEHYNKKIRMVAVFWKSDGTQLNAGTNDFTVKNDTWTRQEFTKVAPPEAALAGFRAYVIQNGTMWMAHPMLQKGTKASSYIENTNDMVDKDKIMDDLADKIATEDYNQKVTELDRQIKANAEGVTIISKKHETFVGETFDAYVKETGSKLKVLDEGILSEVKKGNIISAINQTAEQITIDVKKLNINADTIVTWLTAKGINADVIKISGDKVVIDKNGVEVNDATFLQRDSVSGIKYSVVPKQNLIPDHNFSQMPQIGMRTAAGFIKVGSSSYWKVHGNIYKELPGFNSEGTDFMLNALSISYNDWLQLFVNEGLATNKKYTFSFHSRITHANSGAALTGKPSVRLYYHWEENGVAKMSNQFTKTFTEPGFDGKVRREYITFEVPKNIPANGSLKIEIILFCEADGWVTVGGTQLVEGSLPTVYDWGKTLDGVLNGYSTFNNIAIGNQNITIGYQEADNKVLFAMNTAKFPGKIESGGINVGGYNYGEWGSIGYFNGASGWGVYIQDSGWRKI